MAEVGYIRVSTVDQKTVRQLDGVRLDKVYEDMCSGKDTNRPQLKSLLDYVREGDVVHVHDISRMARNLEDLITLVKGLTGRGVQVRFHRESLTFTGEVNPMQDLMLSMLGAIYQFERSMILERQREGIIKAKEAGKYKGRPASVDREKILKLLASGLSIRKTAKEAGVAASTVQRVKAEVGVI
ncbi:recombinase family protein [Halomonas urmiana]|uniref:Recombinase family protein n=1 Tax=Halomonas urmiana TaxID=490901 RepID=A0A5R8MJ46_9GAMM|nr:recombinase family protein [Halomonas urmiana]TLF52040.1 recombinase family protein [Halomonas urmiana]